MTGTDLTLISFPIRLESDAALARTRVRAISGLLGLSAHDRTRLGVATSELVRHALRHGDGQLSLGLEGSLPERLWVEVLVRDSERPGRIARGRYTPGEGPDAAQKLLDHVERRPHPEGFIYRFSRPRPLHLPPLDLATIDHGVKAHLQEVPAPDTSHEIAQQNRELMLVLDEVREQSEALGQANLELEETNRGVVALHAELDARAELLRQNAEIKSRLVSLVGHEFRTPLGSIRMLAELLLQDDAQPPLTSERRRHVELIHHTAMELTELVDDLLDLSKAQAGKMGVHVTTYEVGSIFGGLRVMLRPLTRSDAVELSFESVEELPPMTSDASKVSLILRNLISNALKFTTHGSVRVSATLLPSDRLRFVVADTGVGIHPRDHERIFEEFSQVENPLQGGVKGTGLGLALVRRLAQMLGGEVSVESELGRGSTFTVELPRVLEDPAHEPGTSPTPASSNRSQPPAFQAAPRKRQGAPRILVIDDDPSARHVLTHHLRRAHCIVLQAEDGARGLWMARREQPDLIFMDLEMPALSGWEVLPQLRNEKETRHIPVVIYTGMDTDEDVVTHLDAQGLLLKQGDLAELGSRALELVRSFVPVDEDEVGPRA